MRKMILALAAFALVFTVGYAQAQMQVPRDQAIQALTKRGEKIVFRGIDNAGNLIEILCNEGDGEWSFLVTLTDGRTVMIGSGQGCEVSAGRITGGRHKRVTARRRPSAPPLLSRTPPPRGNSSGGYRGRRKTAPRRQVRSGGPYTSSAARGVAGWG